MHKWASTSAKSVLMAAGFVALGSGVAFADTDAATSGNGSVLGGNQAVANADIPVNLSGNAVSAILGTSGASTTDTGAAVVDHHHNEVATSGNGSVLGGNQLVVDGDVPVNVTGNAIGAVGGVAGAAATDTGALVAHGHHGHHGHDGHDGDEHEHDRQQGHEGHDGYDVEHQGHSHDDHDHEPDVATSGNGSILGGNQLVADLDVPVNVSGNAIGAVGGVAGAAATDTGALVLEKEPEVATSGNGSLVGGNQLVAHGDVPVNATGNAVAAVASLAGASSTDTGAAVVHQSATEHQAGALDAAPVVRDLPEIPVSQMLPVDYTLSETTAQAVREHAPEHADELPEAAPSVDVVGELLGAAGIGL